MLELSYSYGYRDQHEDLRRLLFREARHGECPVFVDGGKLSQGPAGSEVVDAVEVPSEDGEAAGFIGWSLHNLAKPGGLLVLVANGVALEATVLAELPRGMVAVLDARHLERDLSRMKVIRDARFEQLRELALTASKLVPRPAPQLIHPLHELSSRKQLMSSVIAGTAMFAVSCVAGPVGLAVGLAAASTALVGGPMLHSSRSARVQRHGWLAIGEVETVKALFMMSVEGERVVCANLRVRGPDGTISKGPLYTDRPPKVGDRIFVRTHPKHPELFTPAVPRPSRVYQTRSDHAQVPNASCA